MRSGSDMKNSGTVCASVSPSSPSVTIAPMVLIVYCDNNTTPSTSIKAISPTETARGTRYRFRNSMIGLTR